MGSRYTVEEQANRLPQEIRELYRTTQLDRLEIDGNEFSGYFEYSFMEEKTYVKSPERSNGGIIGNLNSYVTFLTPHIIIKYNYMGIEDYRRLIQLLQSKNEFTVTCYDIVANKRVSHKMYFATTAMPTMHQRNLQALGIIDYTIELIGTNSDVEEYTLTYNFNIPSDVSWSAETSSTQTFARNSSDIVGGANAQYTNGSNKVNISSRNNTNPLVGSSHSYIFGGWFTSNNLRYNDGDAYFINSDMSLTARWTIVE